MDEFSSQNQASSYTGQQKDRKNASYIQAPSRIEIRDCSFSQHALW